MSWHRIILCYVSWVSAFCKRSRS